MQSKSIGIFKEPAHEQRVSIIPQTVKRLIDSLGVEVYVEENAGLDAGFDNDSYKAAGAIVVSHADLYEHAGILTSINPIYSQQPLKSDKVFVGIYNMMFHRKRINGYLQEQVSLYSLDLVPRTTKAQSMDVLSSMASLSGYKAILKAAELYGSVLPMFTTAAGTLRPAKVLVLGAGVAGLQAIATARRLGAVVEAFDVRTSAGEEVRSLGAKFIEVEGAEENAAAGGYAIEQNEDYKMRQKKLIHKHISEASIVISTANIPGKKAPVLIEAESVNAMQPGSVIVDLASEQGGNCSLSKDGETVDHGRVKIVGNSYLAGEMPLAASQMLSNNYFAFLKHLFQTKDKEEDPILKGCKVVHNGQVVHPAFKSQIITETI